MLKKIFQIILLPGNSLAKVFLGIFIILFFLLGYLDYLQPIEDFLKSDPLTFRIGTLEFSLFRIVYAILTIFILFWITGILATTADKWIRNIRGVKTSNKALIAKITQVFIYVIAFFVGLDLLGINLKALTIFSGAVGIGIGFGLRKITANFISGIILLSEKSLEQNDLIQLADGTTGFLRRVNARFSYIETFGGEEVMIPNEQFITDRITNLTYHHNKARIEIKVGVSYSSDIDLAYQLILEAAKEHPRCIDNPGATCFLREFGDNSVNFVLFFWVDDVVRGRLGPQSDVMFSIWRKFKENNIEIPFPQRDIHIKNVKNAVPELADAAAAAASKAP